MSHDNRVPDNMDEGLVPPPLEVHLVPIQFEAEIEAITATAENSPDNEVIATICETFNSFTAAHAEFFQVLLAVLAPPAVGDSEARLAYMQELKRSAGSKCRCDAQWYAKEGVENIAFGCKTCAMSSASCICVSCFEAGDHEGHDFYISRSDYGCCDCGDIYAWKKSGFCSRHTGPLADDDPTNRLDGWTRRLTRLVASGLFASAFRSHADPAAGSGHSVTGAIFEYLMEVAAKHDGMRRIIGQTLLGADSVDPGCLSEGFVSITAGISYADQLLPVSHELGAAGRQAWTKLVVDLMLDLEFKSAFADVFAKHYSGMVLSRVGGGGKMSDVGDFTCQAFTRPDVALRLSVNSHMVSTLLETTDSILETAMTEFDPESVDAGPAHGVASSVFLESLIERMMAGEIQLELSTEDQPDAGTVLTFTDPAEPSHDDAEEVIAGEEAAGVKILDHAHPVVKTQDAFQCSMDLIYLLDHAEVLDALVASGALLEEHWAKWLAVMSKLQFMNPHKRRTDTHMEFPDPNWSNALTAQGDLMSSFWLVLAAIRRANARETLVDIASLIRRALSDWLLRMEGPTSGGVSSLFCPLNRVLALTTFELVSAQNLTYRESNDLLKSVIASWADVVSLVKLPLRARAFHSEANLNLWVRNGESVNMETKFYSAAFFHHHMSSADATAVRLAMLHPSNGKNRFTFFFRLVEDIFGLRVGEESFGEKLTGFLHLLAELVGQQTELALDEGGLVANRAVALLAVQPRTFSKLRDAKLERWTSTLMPEHNATLESVLATISVPTDEGPTRKLAAPQWLSVDLLSPFYSWSDIQVAEEKLRDHLRVSKMSLAEWFRCHKTVQPIIREQFKSGFVDFLSTERLLAVVMFGLLHVEANPAEFRILKLVIQIVLRLCFPLGPRWRDSDCSPWTQTRPEIVDVTMEKLTEQFGMGAWCHPWSFEMLVDGRVVSIHSLLAGIRDREESAEMKEWLDLALAETRQHCNNTWGPGAAVPSGTTEESGATPKAEKRRHMQTLLMERLNKRQNAFLKEEKIGPATPTDTVSAEECVICLSAPAEKAMGKLGFVTRSSFRAFTPRPFAPVSSALIPNDSSLTFLPFSRQGGEGHTFLRTCNHAVHIDCWTKQLESQAATVELRGFAMCPYCNRPSNVLVGQTESVTEQQVENDANCVRVIADIIGVGATVGRPEIAVLRLYLGQFDQLALSLRKPSPDTDMVSLEKGLDLIVALLKNIVRTDEQRGTLGLTRVPVIAALIARTIPSDRNRLVELFREDFASTAASHRNKVIAEFGLSTGDAEKVVELAMLPWLYVAHTVWHYLVEPNHDLPFEELVTIESALSGSDEFSLLVDQFPLSLDLAASAGAPAAERAPDFSLLVFGSELSKIEPKFVDSYCKRDRVRAIAVNGLRFVSFFPTLIPVIPSIYQKLYTAYLKGKCVRCQQSTQAVLCLLCGSLLCLSRDCCAFGDSGEITHHFGKECAVESVGVFLQLSNADIHLISTAGGRVMVAQWGSLFLDSHGEEDSNLSKPLQLNAGRLEKLVAEIREHSWLWRQGVKHLVWRRPAPHL